MEHDSDFFNEIHGTENNTLKIRNRQSDFLLSVMLNSVMASFYVYHIPNGRPAGRHGGIIAVTGNQKRTDIRGYTTLSKGRPPIKKCILPLKRADEQVVSCRQRTTS